MKKYLVYVMQGEAMCFLHAIMNALTLDQEGYQVKVVLEGQSVKMPKQMLKDKNPMYLEAVEKGLIAGVCKACSKMLGVLEENEKLPYPLLDEMYGHAGVEPFIEKNYTVLVF